MTEIEMRETIANLAPALDLDEARWRDAEKLRKEFVSDYTAAKIPKLTLDQYVIGKGKGNHSFCYRLERSMDDLGRILGANAFKFGVYFGSTKSDDTEMYRFSPHWGTSSESAFRAVKNAIVKLLKDASDGDHSAVAECQISPMFKGKILHLYFPDKYAPVYSKAHLFHFLAELNIAGTYDSGTDMQRALMAYRAQFPELLKRSPLLFMRLLYQKFGAPVIGKSEGSTAALPLLDVAIQGAKFLDALPQTIAIAAKGGGGARKPDYEEQGRKRKSIGDRGELIVLAKERERLTSEGKPKLATKVKHIANQDDSAGYDILSYEVDGTERTIEVKSTTRAAESSSGFFISANELAKAKACSNYFIYFVYSVNTKAPRIFAQKNPQWDGGSFKLEPLLFHVTTL